MGQPIQLEGVGTFKPEIRVDGTLLIVFRPCVELKHALNTRGGRLHNPENIGKSSQELVAQWNEEHPDDPVER